MALKHFEIVRTAIAETVQNSGFHLVDLAVSRSGKKSIVEVFIDSEQGITVDELARMSHLLNEPVEAFSDDEEPYQLMVSSPGLDRPLTHAWQFKRHEGRTVHVRYLRNGSVDKVTGTIVRNEPENVLIDSNGNTHTVPFSAIQEATIQVGL